MPDIRYVCLSDLHFGQNDGLLTALAPDQSTTRVTEPSQVLVSLCENLRALIAKNRGVRKPTLILNGDVLEIALETMNKAAMAFERFIELIMPKNGDPLFEQILYVPGNHDHHFWEMAREAQYVRYMSEHAPGQWLDAPWHSTDMFINPRHRVDSYFLNRLIRRFEHPKALTVQVAYPNLGLRSANGERVVIIHHGHFIERLYRLMTQLGDWVFPDRIRPGHPRELEAENFAWIDFFWSTMGRSGRIGPLVQEVYNSLGYKGARDKILKNVIRSAVDEIDPLGPDHGWAALVTPIVTALVDHAAKKERGNSDDPLSKEGYAGLKEYMQGPLRNQLAYELNGSSVRAAFVFGHTHKPLQEVRQYEGLEGDVPIYNTGGWVVETLEPAPRHGATAVIMDDALNVAQLQLYKEDDFEVRVEDATPGVPNPMRDHIGELIGTPGWKTFSDTVRASVEEHREFLRRRLGPV